MVLGCLLAIAVERSLDGRDGDDAAPSTAEVAGGALRHGAAKSSAGKRCTGSQPLSPTPPALPSLNQRETCYAQMSITG